MLHKSSLLHPNYILLLKNIYSLNNKLNSSSKDTKEKRLTNIFHKWVADPSEVKKLTQPKTTVWITKKSTLTLDSHRKKIIDFKEKFKLLSFIFSQSVLS